MEDSKILNIIKEYFKDNFEDVESDYNSDVLSKVIKNTNNHPNTFNQISGNYNNKLILGYFSETIRYLDVGKFKFSVSKRHEERFNHSLKEEDYREKFINGNYNSIPSTNSETFEVKISRINRKGNSTIFDKKIEVDKKYYDSIINSIDYDEERMMEELTELLGKIRNNKIDNITKE